MTEKEGMITYLEGLVGLVGLVSLEGLEGWVPGA